MQFRCMKCQMPIMVSKNNVYGALDYVTENDLIHYDIRCPKCRKANRISKKQLHHAAPHWERDKEKK